MKDETAEKKPPKKKAEAVALEASPMIYIGPSFRGSDLLTFKVFAEGIPDEFKDDPIHAPLFVAPEELDAARAEAEKAGTRLNVLYGKAVQAHKERS